MLTCSHMCVIYLILFYLWVLELILGFPGCSAGKETAGNEGDSSSTPGWGRSPEEGIAYPLRYFWVSLVAEMVKDPPAIRETWVRYLGWEDLLEEGIVTHSSILAWRILVDRGA